MIPACPSFICSCTEGQYQRYRKQIKDNNNEDLYSVLSPTTAGAQRAYKKIRSKQQSTQNQKTHSHTKTSLEHYTCE